MSVPCESFLGNASCALN